MNKLRVTGLALIVLLATAILFTACPNTAGGKPADGGGNTPATPEYTVNFTVDGTPPNGTLTAAVDGTAINTGAKVQQGKTVEFTATSDDPATHNVDYWTVTGGTFETGTGTSGSTSVKVKVGTANLTVTVKFKLITDPPTMATVTFGVDGTGGTLKAEVDGTEVHSPYQVALNKTVVFTATPANEYYAVEKWTLDGTPIAAAGANKTYSHTVTADATVAVHFKTAPVDVYVSGTSDDKAYVWKNDTPTELNAHETGSNVKLHPYAVRARGNDVYIVGFETSYGSASPRVWKKDGSLHWISTYEGSGTYDIAFYKGKTLVAGNTYDGTDSWASLTDITDTGNPTVTFLYKIAAPIDHAQASALCAGTDSVYAAGYKRNTGKNTVFLWTKSDSGSISELQLGLENNIGYSSNYGLCTAGSAVYVAAGTVWKVEGGSTATVPVPDARWVYPLCTIGTTVYAAGATTTDKAAVWKIEGTSASLHKKLSTAESGVFALCAAGGDLFAAGFYYDTGINKPVWWHIAADGTVTEHKLGNAEGEAKGICVTAQE